MVQYPPPGSFKPGSFTRKKSEEKESEKHEEKTSFNEEKELILNKKSEVLAMALGVQIKTGEDPPTGEISISGYEKKKRLQEKFQNSNDENNTASKSMSLGNIALKGPRSEVHLKQIPDNLNEQIKPIQVNAYREQHDFKRGNRERKEEDQRRYRKFEIRRRTPERDSRFNR